MLFSASFLFKNKIDIKRTILENTSLVNYNVVLVKVSNKHRKKKTWLCVIFVTKFLFPFFSYLVSHCFRKNPDARGILITMAVYSKTVYIIRNGVCYKNFYKDASLKDFHNFEWFVQRWMISTALNDLYYA